MRLAPDDVENLLFCHQIIPNSSWFVVIIRVLSTSLSEPRRPQGAGRCADCRRRISRKIPNECPKVDKHQPWGIFFAEDSPPPLLQTGGSLKHASTFTTVIEGYDQP